MVAVFTAHVYTGHRFSRDFLYSGLDPHYKPRHILQNLKNIILILTTFIDLSPF